MVTAKPRAVSKLPKEEAVSPLPSDDATPPVTKMCLVDVLAANVGSRGLKYVRFE